MVKTCCVHTCPSESYGGCNISFHRFPNNEEMRQKWLCSIHVKQKITKNSVVCSRHFKPSCFYIGNSRRLLKTNAIPTIPPVTKTGGGPGDLSPLDTRLAAILDHHPGERNLLEEGRQMPIISSEPQNSRAEEQMDMPSGKNFQEVIIIPHENYDYSAEEMTSQEDETVASNPSQDRSSELNVLLDMGCQQAQANEKMAAAIENLAAAGNKIAKAMENMATAISNLGDKIMEMADKRKIIDTANDDADDDDDDD